jgi:hypothetical protein
MQLLLRSNKPGIYQAIKRPGDPGFFIAWNSIGKFEKLGRRLMKGCDTPVQSGIVIV